MYNNCNYCKSTDIIFDSKQGDLICKSCGCVVCQHFENETPVFTKTTEQKSNATSTNIIIKRPHLNMNSTEENRSLKIYELVKTLVTQICMNNDFIIDRAMQVYNKLINTKIPRIKKDELMATACTFIALRQSNTPFSFNELAALCDNVSKRELGRCCKRCFVFLQKSHTTNNWGDQSEKTKSILDNIPRYATHLGFRSVEIIYLKKISRHVEKLGIVRGCNPLSITAAVFVYVANYINLPLTTVSVANAIGIAENTVSKSYKFLSKKKKLEIFPTDLVDKLDEFRNYRLIQKQ